MNNIKKYAMNIHILDFLESIRKDFIDYTFSLDKQGSGWCRIFIMKEGISLGRINFEPVLNSDSHRLCGWSHYKPHDYEYSSEDKIFYQLGIYFGTDEVRDFDGDNLVKQAKVIKQQEINEKMKWRKANPLPANLKTGKPKTRKKLSTSWMGKFRTLVYQQLFNINNN